MTEIKTLVWQLDVHVHTVTLFTKLNWLLNNQTQTFLMSLRSRVLLSVMLSVDLWHTCVVLLKVVWFAAWFGVVLLGIDIGLGVGVIMALVVVIWKSSRSESRVLFSIHTVGSSLLPFPWVKYWHLNKVVVVKFEWVFTCQGGFNHKESIFVKVPSLKYYLLRLQYCHCI